MTAWSMAGPGSVVAIWRMNTSACTRGAASFVLKMLMACRMCLRCRRWKLAKNGMDALSFRRMNISMPLDIA